MPVSIRTSLTRKKIATRSELAALDKRRQYGSRSALVKGNASPDTHLYSDTNEKNLHNVVKARGSYVLGVDCRKSSSSSAHGDDCINHALDRVRLAF